MEIIEDIFNLFNARHFAVVNERRRDVSEDEAHFHLAEKVPETVAHLAGILIGQKLSAGLETGEDAVQYFPGDSLRQGRPGQAGNDEVQRLGRGQRHQVTGVGINRDVQFLLEILSHGLIQFKDLERRAGLHQLQNPAGHYAASGAKFGYLSYIVPGRSFQKSVDEETGAGGNAAYLRRRGEKAPQEENYPFVEKRLRILFFR
jgi:hypothetical protein